MAQSDDARTQVSPALLPPRSVRCTRCVHSDGERPQPRSQEPLVAMTRLDGTGVCLRLAGEQEAAYTTLPRPLTEVDAGTCHGSLRPFLAHETETLVWRAQPLCLCGCTTLPNDHAYVISMQPGRAWTHSWAPTAPAPHEVGFRVGVFVQRHVSSSPHTCRAPWSALASCGCTCTPADRLGGVGASTSATPMGPVWVHARYSWSMYIPSVDAACVHSDGERPHSRSQGPLVAI